MELRVVGEDAIMLYLGSEPGPALAARIQSACRAVEQALGADLIDLVPSYASVLIVYDPLRIDHLSALRRVRGALQGLGDARASDSVRTVVLPVYYAPEAGADLEALAARAGLSVQQVIDLHSATSYRVYAIGFAPGFAYLGQVDERIAAPRLATPRPRVPRGAVAIADRQTAVYPAASPGGWNLIGRCPTRMFDPRAEPTMPVGVGDEVRFEPIDRERFLALGGELS
ncbi:MAG: 5-oxoprolinase subunit PxpB [Halioglobus sp.]|nr:5-oxoprolinase subunit PxpB [Halioglobus sp.]